MLTTITITLIVDADQLAQLTKVADKKDYPLDDYIANEVMTCLDYPTEDGSNLTVTINRPELKLTT